MEKIRVFSMFSGIGGFERGIQLALGNAAEFIGCAEVDKHASSIFQYHFPGVRNYGDVTKINTAELPDFDLLVAGFCCQSFSIAGRRLGFEDPRGKLFFEIVRVLKEKKPRFFLLENVKNILAIDEGRTFQVVLESLYDAGYLCECQLVDTQNYGLPQHRERVFIVGTSWDEPSLDVFPIEKLTGTDN